MLYDSIFVTFSKWQIHRVKEKINGCQGLGVGMGNRELLSIREICHVLFVVMVTSLYTLTKIHETVYLEC